MGYPEGMTVHTETIIIFSSHFYMLLKYIPEPFGNDFFYISLQIFQIC